MENRIKEIRIAKKMTQEDLAKLSGVPRSTIAMLESSSRVPRVDVAAWLARGLGTTIEQVFIVPWNKQEQR